jgi:hypothetical protein
MQLTRILPDLQCSLLCEEVRQEANSNFFLIGVINYINVPQVPVTVFKLTLFNRWTAGVGAFTESARLIAPDQTTVLRQSSVKFQLKDAGTHATTISLFGQVELKTPGTYFVEVLVDDVMKLRYPVPVVVTPQNPNPQQQAQPPQPPPS